MSAKELVEKAEKGEFTYKTLPMAAMIPNPPTSPVYKSGTWRVTGPVIDQGKCIKCLLCWVYCPDMAIIRLEDDSVKVDYEHCKGCGVCASVCPVKAITFEEV